MGRTELVTLEVNDETPGRKISVSDLLVGDSVSQSVVFDSQIREAFLQLARDRAPVHGDASFARARGFDNPIVQGLCVTTRFSRLIGMYLPGESAVVESLAFKFRKPVLHDASVTFRVRVTRVQSALRVVRLDLTASVAGEVCVKGECQCLLR